MDSVENIKSDFHNHRIIRKETIKRLISAIESLEQVDRRPSEAEIHNYWDATDSEVEYIKAFRKLNLKSDEVFDKLENIIVSEQDFVIKLTTLRTVAELFPEKYYELLIWLYKNDSRFEIVTDSLCPEEHNRLMSLADIYDNIMWSNNHNLRELQKIVEMKTSSKTYQYVLEGVDPIEARILTIFGLEMHKLEKVSENNDYYYNEYDCIYKINGEGHVTEIFMKFGEASAFIPQKINLLQHLEKLILIGGSIRVIPNSVGKLKRLKELDLGFNSIGNLTQPKSFPESLGVLCLRDNRIKSIPESILRLKNLKKLRLCSNQIEKLPESFKSAINIVELDLSDNKISRIPESLKELKSVTLIELRANPVNELPEYFDSAEWLSKIKISPPPIDPFAVLPEYASKLGLDAETETLSRKLLELNKSRYQSKDANPETILAAVLYYVCKEKNCKINGNEITQKFFSNLIGATEYCVDREYYRLLQKLKKAN